MAIAVKDNISTQGIETTCASKILQGYVPPYDAHAVELIKGAGAAVAGKTNMDEFGMGTSTENSAFGPTLNPCDTIACPVDLRGQRGGGGSRHGTDGARVPIPAGESGALPHSAVLSGSSPPTAGSHVTV